MGISCILKEEVMRKITVSVRVEAEKLRAIQFYAGRKDATVEAELENCIEKLYEKYVPGPTREYIENQPAAVRPPRPSRPAPEPEEADHEQ